MKGDRMVHFDFTVSDEEADTIFDCINGEIERMVEEKYDWANVAYNRESFDLESSIEWFDNRIKYLKELKAKMKNI